MANKTVAVTNHGAWAASHAYILGDTVTNDTLKVYKCITAGTSAGSGGPTGTGSDITDGDAHWAYQATVDGGYTTLNAALAGESTNLVTNTRILTIDCYNFEDTTPASTGTGYTTSSSYYIKIQAHDRHGGVYGTSSYRLLLNNSASGDNLILYSGNVWVDGLLMERRGTAPSGADCLWSYPTITATYTISNNIFKNSTPATAVTGVACQSSTGNMNSVTFYIYNNIVYGFSANIGYGGRGVLFGRNDTAITAYCYNNTVYNCYWGFNILEGSPTVISKNNIADSNTDNYYGSFNGDSANNLSSSNQNDAPGTDPRNLGAGVTVGFVSTAASGSENLHLASSDTAAKDYGTNLTTDPDGYLSFTTDIDGQTRPATGSWDIGADELTTSYINDIVLRFIGGSTYNKTASVGIGVQTTNLEIANFLRSLAVGINSGIGFTETANFLRAVPVGIGIAISDSERMLFPRSVNVGIGLAVTDSETRNVLSTSSVGVGMAISDSEKANFARSLAVGAGIAISDSEVRNVFGSVNVGAGISISTTENAIFIRLASVGVTIVVTPLASKTGVNIWMKTASVSVNFQVTDSEAATFLRSLGVGIGAAITAAEVRNVPSASSVGIGMNISPIEKADFKRTAPVGVNVQIQDSEVANFPETSSVGIGVNITDSETRNVPSISSVGVGIAATDSEKADFNRLASIQMGMATGDQEKANFPETNSVTITITSSITGSVGGIKVSLVGVGVSPSAVEIANFVRSLLPNVSIQIGATERADFPEISTTGIGLNISASERADFTKSLAVTTNMQVVVSKIATLIRSLNPNISVQTAVAEVANFRRSIGVGLGVGASSTALLPSGKSVFALLNLLIATSVRIERDWAYKFAFESFDVVFDFNQDEIVFTMITDCNIEFSKPAQSFKMERKKFFELN